VGLLLASPAPSAVHSRYILGVRGVSLGILMVAAVAAVLVFSVRSLVREKNRLLQGFASAQQANVRQVTSDLEDRLRDVEEDARVIATLVQGTSALAGTKSSVNEQVLGAFRAMATVVRHYRSLAFLGSAAEVRLAATDPTESPSTAAELTEMSRSISQTGRASPRLRGPVQSRDGRRFYFYVMPVGSEKVVIAIDASRFLQSALRSIPEGRIVVRDPGAEEWTGCAANNPCRPRPTPERAEIERTWNESEGVAWLDDDVAPHFGLSRDMAVAAWLTTGSSDVGSWRVLLVASAAALHAREQTLVKQLVLTALGLVAAIGLVGVFIVRQQRYSAALAERLRSAEALQSLERQLTRAEKLATTGVLAAGIAHEVGTPLGIIRARAELLMDRLGNIESRRALEAIVQQIDRISSTIRQVLDFSRAQPVEVRPVKPDSALRSVTELLDHRFRQQQLSVHVDVDPTLPAMAADPNQFQQVMINVLLNACDACTAGGDIRISAQRNSGAEHIRWEIRDDGEGIAAENLLAVFDPFFTTKKRGEGTGLGLPVAASIVRNHGGEITLSSVPAEGTTVRIVWPIAKERADGQR
jgi:signal transduction histidine kinase